MDNIRLLIAKIKYFVFGVATVIIILLFAYMFDHNILYEFLFLLLEVSAHNMEYTVIAVLIVSSCIIVITYIENQVLKTYKTKARKILIDNYDMLYEEHLTAIIKNREEAERLKRDLDYHNRRCVFEIKKYEKQQEILKSKQNQYIAEIKNLQEKNRHLVILISKLMDICRLKFKTVKSEIESVAGRNDRAKKRVEKLFNEIKQEVEKNHVKQ